MNVNQAWNPYAGLYGYNSGGYSPVAQTPLPQQQPQQQFVQQPAQQGLPTFNRVVWARGLEAARSVMLYPNETVMILDSEGDKFYIASAGQDGRPNPLKSFRYEKDEATAQPDFVTRKEFNELKALLEGHTAVQSAESDDGK